LNIPLVSLIADGGCRAAFSSPPSPADDFKFEASSKLLHFSTDKKAHVVGVIDELKLSAAAPASGVSPQRKPKHINCFFYRPCDEFPVLSHKFFVKP
jgi:hypothetical protein